MNFKINGIQTSVLVNKGSSLDIIDSKLLRKMKTVAEMKKSNTKGYAFGQKKALPIKERCTCTIETNSTLTTAEFYTI